MMLTRRLLKLWIEQTVDRVGVYFCCVRKAEVKHNTSCACGFAHVCMCVCALVTALVSALVSVCLRVHLSLSHQILFLYSCTACP